MSDIVSTRYLTVERRGACVKILFNRPEARNAFNEEMWSGLRDVIAALTQNTSIRILLMRGANGNFCAGGDLRARAALRDTDFTDVEDPLFIRSCAEAEVYRMIEALPQLVVTAVEGVAAGAGVGFAALSDIVIAESASTFMTPEVRLGFPPAQVLPFIIKRVGQSGGRYMLLSGRKLTSEEAQRIGLVHVLVGGKVAFEAFVTEWLEDLRHCAPQAIATAKSLFASAEAVDYESLAARCLASAVRGAEGREGEIAFFSRRKPSWFSE